MHTPIPLLLLLLLLSTLALATTATALLIPGSRPVGPPPSLTSPPQPPPPQDLTHFITNKLSTPRKWMSEKAPAPTAHPPSTSATPSVSVTPPVSNVPAYTDPLKLQRFVQELHASRRPSQLRRRGIKSKPESLPPPRPGAAGEVSEREELTEAEFNAMFEEYILKHDVAVGLPPKGRRQKEWEGSKFGGYVRAIMSAPGRGRGREAPWCGREGGEEGKESGCL